MRVIIIKESDLESLCNSLELEKLRLKDDNKEFAIDAIHRRFNYVVRNWVDQVSKD